MNKYKKIIFFVSTLLFLIGITVLFLYISPTEIVNAVGAENTYIILFFIALLSGMSFVTHIVVFTTIITFALAGLNPLLLGLVTAPGLLVGNYIIYFFGGTVHGILGEKLKLKIENFTERLKKHRHYNYLPLLIYFYVSFIPISPEALLLPLASMKYPFKKVIIPLFLGEVTFVTIISLLAQQGVQLIHH